MFYLMTHSTHFILRLYGVGHMVKDHSDSERGNALPPHGFFYMHHPTDRIAHTMAFVTPVVKHWLEREIAQWVHPMKDRSDDPSHHERTHLPRGTRIILFNSVGKSGNPNISHNAFVILSTTADQCIVFKISKYG